MDHGPSLGRQELRAHAQPEAHLARLGSLQGGAGVGLSVASAVGVPGTGSLVFVGTGVSVSGAGVLVGVSVPPSCMAGAACAERADSGAANWLSRRLASTSTLNHGFIVFPFSVELCSDCYRGMIQLPTSEWYAQFSKF